MTAYALGEFYKNKIRLLPLNINKRPKYYGSGLIEQIVEAFYKLSERQKNDFVVGSGVDKQTIYGWKYNLSKGIGKTRSTLVKVTKSRPLKTLSSAADGSKIIGTTLQSMLSDMSDYDIVKQSTMIETLHEAGYDKLSVMKTMKIPSPEEFETIMKAVQLLSKDYTITKKG